MTNYTPEKMPDSPLRAYVIDLRERIKKGNKSATLRAEFDRLNDQLAEEHEGKLSL